MNIITHKYKLLVIALIALWSPFVLLQAQNKLSVLHVQSHGKYERIFTPQTNLKKLLQAGSNQQATVEFWAKHNTAGSTSSAPVNWSVTNFEGGNTKFSLDVSSNEVSLSIGDKETKSSLLLNEQLFKNSWHHFAITFDGNANEVRGYIDGQEKLFIQNSNFDIEDLYLISDAKTDLFLAEYRAWSAKKSKEQIQLEQYRSFYQESKNRLSELKNNGLQTLYTNDIVSNEDAFGGKVMITTSWKNLLYEHFPNDNLVKQASFVSAYKNTGIATVNSKLKHPILSLDKIIVKASDGDGSSHTLLSGANGVVVSWLHAKDMDEYQVLRRNIREGTISTVIHTERNVSSKQPSEEIVYIDREVLPNELYEYTIQAKKQGGDALVGKDDGFVLPNGKVSGIIETSSRVATKFAKIEAKAMVNPGGALHIEKDAAPIFIRNIEAFRKATKGATFEFWYKTPVIGAETNTILKIGNAELEMAKNTIVVKQAGKEYIKGTRTSDTKWHHYAFTFGEKGGMLFEDGKLLSNASTSNLFTIDLSGTNAFCLSAATKTGYYLDEVRFWNVAKTPVEIANYARHIVGGNETNLFAYYRFDFNDAHKTYNFSSSRRGQYTGESKGVLKHLAANEQPTISYATYTNETGNYEFTSLSTGVQGITNNDNKFEYTIEPSKPRFEFLPKTKQAGVPRRLNGAEVKNVNFTDVSSLPITGVISYKVGNELYPVTKGTSLTVDGSVIQSAEDTKVTTDNTGTYAIKVAPGKHIITPNKKLTLTNEERLNEGSLGFDGKTGYGESNQTVDSNNESFMWSGFVKPYLKKKNTDVIPTTQTILQWGDLSLKLINNTTLKVFLGTQEKLSEATSITEQTQFVFFGISYNKDSGTMTLYVNNRKKSTAISDLTIDSKLIIGSENVNNKFINYAKSHVDLLEYRSTALTDEDVKKLREGKYIAESISKLALSYSFDQKNGRKAINIANISKVQNNYIQLNEGCNFDNTIRKQYIREVEYSYKATNVDFDPKGNSYDLVVEEPLQNVNFENTTRRSFIGNIVVPCNNNVGAWTGKIIRTDIEFPKFEKSINAANFNNDATVFTVNDLLPGQYRVEITNTDTNRVLNSPIIDLRRKNVVFDFEFRNDIELEIKLFKFDMTGVRDVNNMRDYVGNQINSTCDGSYTFKSHDGFKMDVKVFERYGAKKCPVEGAEVTLGGDAILSDSNLSENSLSQGVVEFFTQVSSPNFLGDHTRNFLISAKHNGRTVSISRKAIITGARQGNSDFTLIDPQVGFVLHDPPGDNSFATLAKGATYSYSSSAENGGGLEVDNSIGAKLRVKKQVLTGVIAAPLGVGTVAGFVNPVLQTSSDTEGLIGVNFDYVRHSGSLETITLDKAISTPSDPTFVGEDADVFIGMSKVISFGTGKVLEMNGCTPVVKNSDKVAKPTSLTPFVFTKQSLVDNVIPNLYRLAIAKSDKNNNIETAPDDRDHLDLKGTLDKLLAKNPKDKEDKDIVNYLHQITTWSKIIDDNHKKLQAAAFNTAPDFSSTTKKLTNDNDQGQSGVGINPATLDRRITFDGLTEISYTLSREKSKNSGNSFTEAPYVGVSFSKDFTAFGVGLSLSNQSRIHNFNSQVSSTDKGNNRVDSFTFKDDDAGDQFDVSIRRDKQYDTPMFLTNGGRSSCPFESGTVPREGVELIVDKVVGYGTGDESVLFNLTLRNTQIAKDATRKTYIVGMSGASNPLGAVVNLNESPIFEPTTSSKFVFDLDPKSPTGVKQEIKAQLRIARGTDAPSVISYENIKIQMYSECEQDGDRYRSYGVDEYNEVGVKPLSEILVTAHFTGACIETITADAPQNDWVVNGSDQKKLDFKFKVPGLVKKDDKFPINDFSIDLEYTIKGNNMPKVLKKLDLKALKASLNEKTGFVEYSADVSGLTNGEYNFRIVPVCGDGGSDNPNNRKNPTPFVKGKIARQAPQLVLTTPDNGGIFTSGTISAKFSAPINPATVNLNSLAMRGVLGGIPKPLTSVKLDNVQDKITIPHNSKFNLEEKATIEMWVNPAKYPTAGSVPILQKGNNYAVLLASDGKIDLGNGIKSSVGLQPFTWTHVAVIADKVNGKVTIYFNGKPVGSGNISTILKTNEDPLVIAPVANNDAFVGSLDEIRLWRSLRTPAQLVSNMKSQLLGNEDTLEAYFVFNNNTLAKEGINGQPDEAIQDFTGNASGTTATSITFVTNEEAAPLDQTKTVEDVQFTTTMSENNTIINFNMKIEDREFVEGARLTVFVKDKKLEDPLGNKVDKTSWSFIIDRSKLKWSHNNISITQNQGNSTLINYVDLINKDGGVDVAYTFENLPVWFEVKSGANPAKDAVNIIKATETNSNLEFEVKSFLNPGVHSANIYIKTSNKDTGKKLGVESFRVEVTVNCPEPVVSQDFATKYPFNMNMKGNILINSQKSFDVNDVVKAYVGNELRGYAKADANGLVDLTVWGNIGETSALTFRVWDASACTEYEGIKENYSLSINSNVGTSFAPIKFTVGTKVTQRIPIVAGYQELSFNLRDNASTSTLSLNAIKKLPENSQIVDILDPTKSASLGGNGVFTGTLKTIDINRAYLINCAASHDQITYLEVSGTPVDINTNITIKGGKITNAIPFYPNDLQRTGYALRSFTSTKVSEGDRIERRGLFAEYSTANGWRGSLTHLTPGLGYIFKSQTPGVINYSGIVKNERARSFVLDNSIKNESITTSELEETPSYKDLDLTIDVNKYANFMYINGVIDDENVASDEAQTILAFVNNELRGVSKAEFINGAYHYYIGVGGNTPVENIRFKLYNGIEIAELGNVEQFEANQVLGDMKLPYSFRLKAKESESSIDYGLSLSQNRPNPVDGYTKISFSISNEAHVNLSLYNLLGQKLHTFVSGKVKANTKHEIQWNGEIRGTKLQTGVYMYELRVNGKRLKRKLIIK
ncbi:LamG-like jellyroll fold domain-containing protein [uncultured Tenacibaculum sp.]|uniref:LamG-like jellyroll fold domain-containing protein n=1 Tax=uncultured Tenacibaculum sp. TaxID=174713 RepID=UPI00260615E9|nr:LamG-like jellyroll fold domain-containing protein [uncultured Tenacibaculum sp.]